MSSNVSEREPINLKETVVKAPPKVGRTPIKITGTDINGNTLEINIAAKPFLTEGESLTLDQTQINLNKREVTSISVNSRTSPDISVNFRKFPCISVNPRKSQYIPVNPRNGNVGVLTDRPPAPHLRLHKFRKALTLLVPFQ